MYQEVPFSQTPCLPVIFLPKTEHTDGAPAQDVCTVLTLYRQVSACTLEYILESQIKWPGHVVLGLYNSLISVHMSACFLSVCLPTNFNLACNF